MPVQYGFNVVPLPRVLRIEQLNPQPDEGLVHVLLGHLAVHLSAHNEAKEELVHHLKTVQYVTRRYRILL